MKPTYTNIAKYYNITRQTASSMEERVPKIYEAMRYCFIKENATKSNTKPSNPKNS